MACQPETSTNLPLSPVSPLLRCPNLATLVVDANIFGDRLWVKTLIARSLSTYAKCIRVAYIETLPYGTFSLHCDSSPR